MPKYYCDYCDTHLTHDSPSVRKTHCSGRKHRDNVRNYYQKWMEEQAQRLIDNTTAAFKMKSMKFEFGNMSMVPPPGYALNMPPPNFNIPPPNIRPPNMNSQTFMPSTTGANILKLPTTLSDAMQIGPPPGPVPQPVSFPQLNGTAAMLPQTINFAANCGYALGNHNQGSL